LIDDDAVTRKGEEQEVAVGVGGPACDRALRPLLKWAGGKRQLLPSLRRFYPAQFENYFEPFLGSGAVFFDLLRRGRLEGRRVSLTDSNPDLIGCYGMVREEPVQVLRHLARLAEAHARGGSDHFYDVRDRFNRRRSHLTAVSRQGYTPDLAAMLLYLNRTGYNGLFRLNARGVFNVPAGRYVRPRIHDPDHLHAVSAALSRPGVSLALASFETVLQSARKGDFLYFDPPYAPLTATARFTAYTAQRFTLEDHQRLRDVAVALAARGCSVLVSNSSADVVESLYATDPRVRAAGLRVWRVPARRAINSRADGRGAVTEILLTNVIQDRVP
jgi:DNA adenine methylase